MRRFNRSLMRPMKYRKRRNNVWQKKLTYLDSESLKRCFRNRCFWLQRMQSPRPICQVAIRLLPRSLLPQSLQRDTRAATGAFSLEYRRLASLYPPTTGLWRLVLSWDTTSPFAKQLETLAVIAITSHCARRLFVLIRGVNSDGVVSSASRERTLFMKWAKKGR